MKDDEGKPFTTVHSRFQACCLDGCGLISAHQDKQTAMLEAEKHTCQRVVVHDVMSRRGLDSVIFKRDERGSRFIDNFLRKLNAA
jgi:hypothetical protein